MANKTIEFESPHFLHSLFADDLSLLKYLEEKLKIVATTRDSWVKFEGDDDQLELAGAILGDLETARRKGGEITPHSFRYAIDAVINSNGENGSDLNKLLDFKLLGGGSKPAVSPRTANQLIYLKALEAHDVVFGIGPAGTGKTYLAMAYALEQLKKRNIDRIVLTRPAVEAGESLGFLPGALEEKVLPYLRPLYDALNDMLETTEAQRFAEKNLIEIAPLAYMRGRTLNRAYVILDEAQNATQEQMFMLLTRLGDDSKCVVTGDPTQIDLRPKGKSGILEAMNFLKDVEGVAFTKFERKDVVRNPVVARIIEAYEKGRGEEG